MINGLTFDDRPVAAANDRQRNRDSGALNGISRGCALTYDASNIYVGAGTIYVMGGQIDIVGTETVPLPTVTTTDTYYLVLTVDLSLNNTESVFNQGYFEVINTARVKQDLFNGGTKYQLELAQMTLTSSGIASFAEIDNRIKVLFPAVSWSASAPYTQTVSVPLVTERSKPIYDVYNPSNDPDTLDTVQDAFNAIRRLVTGNGTVTLVCGNLKPAVDLTIILEGI